RTIQSINERLRELSDIEKITYIDLYSSFVDSQTGKMNTVYTNDGLHLVGKGYLKWVEIVKPYVTKK
ncbi:MAG: sialate O-acetylesterase, partial [Bacteroides sp.]|nr:sialate O-acetylesterase [Bacteroides sp.]